MTPNAAARVGLAVGKKAFAAITIDLTLVCKRSAVAAKSMIAGDVSHSSSSSRRGMFWPPTFSTPASSVTSVGNTEHVVVLPGICLFVSARVDSGTTHEYEMLGSLSGKRDGCLSPNITSLYPDTESLSTSIDPVSGIK